ncbi:MAG: biotin--[acetyl-CoA-carboxylase] ligase [Actinomycetota bacterium]
MEREPFDATEFERIATIVPWVHKVFAFASIASTNDEASRLAKRAEPEGTVVVADHQTAGRGRLDREWISEPGLALLASWIVRPPFFADRSLLALASGVAVADAIDTATGIAVDLKWPNDVMVDGRKLAGILCEGLPDGSTIVGIGVNVRTSEFPLDLADRATSLLLERSRPIGRAALLASILEAFSPFAHAPASALEGYRKRCSTIGTRVRVLMSGQTIEGSATEVNDQGELTVVDDSGEHLAIRAGDVTHLR